MLSLEEAEERARKGADRLEEAINKANGLPPGTKDPSRWAYNYNRIMSLLAEKEGIKPANLPKKSE